MGAENVEEPHDKFYNERISEYELRVILAMRQSERHGRAIYNYTMSFDTYEQIDHDAPPYTG